MRQWTVALLRCPITGQRLRVAKIDKADGDELVAGLLVTDESGPPHQYRIDEGVPDFTVSASDADQTQSIRSFGHEWQAYRDWGWMETYPSEPQAELKYRGGLVAHSEETFAAKTRFTPADVAESKLVLDAGCGNGRFSFQAQKLGARVVGVDASEAAYVAFRNLRSRGIISVDIVRGNVLRMPFEDGIFDYVFSIGVMQHTGDGRAFLRELSRVAKQGAPFSVNCYGTGVPSYELVDRVIRSVTTRLGREHQWRFAKWLARISRQLRSGNDLARSVERRLYRYMMILPTEHHMFDWYTPKLAYHYSPSDLKRWVAEIGARVTDAAPNFQALDYDDGPRRRGHSAFQFRALNMKEGACADT